MGTYTYFRLKDKSEKNIEKCNRDIERLGYPTERFEGITYGFFISRARLQEDARFMNEEEEGLKQCPHFQRPITAEFLEKNFFWNEIGCGIYKVSCGDDNVVNVISKWLKENRHLLSEDSEIPEQVL